MALEPIVQQSLTDAAADSGVPAAAAKRLAVLASNIADGELDPVRDQPEMTRRIELLLRGYDA